MESLPAIQQSDVNYCNGNVIIFLNWLTPYDVGGCVVSGDDKAIASTINNDPFILVDSFHIIESSLCIIHYSFLLFDMFNSILIWLKRVVVIVFWCCFVASFLQMYLCDMLWMAAHSDAGPALHNVAWSGWGSKFQCCQKMNCTGRAYWDFPHHVDCLNT